MYFAQDRQPQRERSYSVREYIVQVAFGIVCALIAIALKS
jgi:hypothetical protein